MSQTTCRTKQGRQFFIPTNHNAPFFVTANHKAQIVGQTPNTTQATCENYFILEWGGAKGQLGLNLEFMILMWV